MATAFAFILAIFTTTLLNGDGEDGDSLNGDITRGSLHGSDLVDNIETFCHFAEHGIVAVEMRRATNGLVSLTLTSREHLTHAAFKHIQGPLVVHLALYDIELRAAGGLLGVHLVGLAGSGQSAFLVEVVVLDFGGNGITRVKATK